MKRLITFICLIVVIFLGYRLITNGFENDSFEIASYNTIETKSEALTKKLANYDKKNQEEYDTAVNSLNSSIKMFKDSKTKYETIYEELADVLNSNTDEEETMEEIIYSDKEKYKVDFLFVTLGGYARQEGVDVTFKITTSSTTDPNSTTLNYFLADLQFSVTGQYIDVASFISDLENDDKLGFEINGFQMAQGNTDGYTGVSAKFTVKDVPIDSESYIESSSFSEEETNGNQDQNNPENVDPNNPGDTNTVVDGNTTSNTVSNDTNNTVSNTINNTTNTVSNNTVQ